MNQSLVVSDKEEFIRNVQKWVYVESQLKEVNEKTKKMRSIKTDLTEKICNYMDKNPNIKNKIGIGTGEITMYQKKDYTPLTFSYIEKCLNEIIQDENQVEFVVQYLKDKREITTSSDLRKNNK